MEELLREFLEASWQWGDPARARKLLVEHPEFATADIYTAAVTGQSARVVQILEADPEAVSRSGGPRGWPPLLYLSWSCFQQERLDDLLATARLLLERGADPNCGWDQDGTFESALYGTVDAHCPELTALLVDAGADPNDGESLYHACEHFDTRCLEALARGRLDPDQVSYCIKHVIDMGYHEGVLWFLEHGADPNAVHPASGETSLHWAVKRRTPRASIEALLDRDADPSIRTREGVTYGPAIKASTPLDLALRLGRTAVAELLVAHGADPGEPGDLDRFLHACARGDRAEAERGSDVVPSLDETDRTLISHVAQFGHTDAVLLMADLGFPLDARGWMSATPLHWAACLGDLELVRGLLERGAAQEDVGGYFATPLNAARSCQWTESPDYPPIIELLSSDGRG